MRSASQLPAVRGALDATGPAMGGAVMGTGIVSIALTLAGQPGLSAALMWITAALWAVLALAVAARLVVDPQRLRVEATMPASLTGVAGTAVLGTRLTHHGWPWAGAAALVAGCALGLALGVTVVRHMRRPTLGSAFLLTVALESLALLAAVLAVTRHDAGLTTLALVLWAGGLVAYPWVLRSFDFSQLTRGAGDHWVTGGALAISALASDGVVAAITATGALGDLRSLLDVASLCLLVAAFAWVPALVVGEVVRPRLHYTPARWATVFPLGMYAAASFHVGTTEGPRQLINFAHAWVWVALAVWAIVAGAGVAHAAAPLRGRRAHPR